MVQDDDPRVDRTWVREWENFAPFYLAYEDQYVCFPTYSPDRPSSNEMTVETYLRESAYESRYRDQQGRAQTYVITKPVEDAQAALWLLYDPKPGSYGYINCGLVTQIVSERELVLRVVRLLDGRRWNVLRREEEAQTRAALRALLTQITPGRSGAKSLPAGPTPRQRGEDLQNVGQLINEAIAFSTEARKAAIAYQQNDAFKRRHWHIIGYNTERIVADELWPQGEAAAQGLHLAIVAADEATVTAVPAAWLERELTELQFLEVLESRGLTKAAFVELVNQARREHRRDYIPAVIAAMEGLAEEQDEGEGEDENEGTEDGGGINDTVELAD